MSTRLYVGRLPYATTEDELKSLFEAHGAVSSASIISDRATGQSKGFGFVEMENDAEAEAAIKALNNSEVGGRSIAVSVARPMERRDSGPSRY
jgi:RNA recognition motif-containing protein